MASKSKQNEEETIEKLVAKSNKTLRDIAKTFLILERCMTEALTNAREELKEQKELFEEVVRINANIDETLGNVLIAIRQNEYLQAHYPAQHGYPELKVVGQHPAKIITKEIQ